VGIEQVHHQEERPLPLRLDPLERASHHRIGTAHLYVPGKVVGVLKAPGNPEFRAQKWIVGNRAGHVSVLPEDDGERGSAGAESGK
jgi:hypothetical protein